ncbi:Right handed beta helix region [Streptomyces sp. WMMB 714]|uniref:right-handed parallel beta-helix repeat-containing protein n=1 Tax=Streptomyces sp. WMMB 714 TaxID=1286822 RepID=UPI0005F7CC64|nr:right-handed parallel beta-helix repeat-containing protein [Streptomyces sp. WMMB 714]SCK58309.1 Right handed beta helix region [Streptomyces sp. WMMB 714]
MTSTRSVAACVLSTGMAALLWATGLASPASAVQAVIVVGTPSATCANPQHPTIQDGVDAADAGDTIRVCPGTYNEAVNVTKSLVFRGAQAGVDARSGRTNPARESVVQPPGASTGFTVASGVSNVTIDGFTIQDSEADGINTLSAGSGFTISNNIVTGNRIGINFRSPGTTSTDSRIRRNRIVDNNNSLPAGGSGVFLGGGQGTDNLSITQNRFGGHVNADVNTQGVLGGGDPAEALTIASNTSVDSATFLVLINANNPRVQSNRISKGPAEPSGSAMLVDANTDGAQILGNQITGGQGTGIRVAALFGPDPSTNMRVTRNTIRSRTDGVLVEALDSGTFSSNIVENSTANGIQVDPAVAPVTPLLFSSNISRFNAVWDARDQTSGGGTAGTANTWRGNVCPKDSPDGICR